jgi:hypothetical protein
MAQRLNQGLLPEHYYAEPNTQFGAVEIDVAALRKGAEPAPVAPAAGWTPPAPALTATVNLTALDMVEVLVRYAVDEPQLMAAVEIVSPSNKDRPSSRHDFAVKCAAILGQGASLVVIDVVTSRRADLHAELLRLVQSDAGTEWQSPTRLSAIAYRSGPRGERWPLQVWPHALAVGEPLPTLPPARGRRERPAKYLPPNGEVLRRLP